MFSLLWCNLLLLSLVEKTSNFKDVFVFHVPCSPCFILETNTWLTDIHSTLTITYCYILTSFLRNMYLFISSPLHYFVSISFSHFRWGLPPSLLILAHPHYFVSWKGSLVLFYFSFPHSIARKLYERDRTYCTCSVAVHRISSWSKMNDCSFRVVTFFSFFVILCTHPRSHKNALSAFWLPFCVLWRVLVLYFCDRSYLLWQCRLAVRYANLQNVQNWLGVM